MFASTYAHLQVIAHQCQHPSGSHQSIVGVRTQSGHFLSRETAEYPDSLCSRIATIVLPLLSLEKQLLDITSALHMVPVKDYQDRPFCRQDGAGIASQGDWSAQRCESDLFVALRKQFFKYIVDGRLDKQIVASFSQHSDQPPFSEEQLAPFRVLIGEFLAAQGHVPDWSVPDGQQICLHILHQLSQCMGDLDLAIFPYLLEGVPIGSDVPITPSNCFPLQPTPEDYDPPLLSVHHTNWASAEESPEVVQSLIDKEVDAGWVQKFPGTLEEAQSHFEHGLAIGKLGLALSESRPPRLVLDSTICGVNPQCLMPERTTLPTIKDVMRSYPLRGKPCDLGGVSFDVRSAHKQVAVHKKYHGHLCFQHNGQLYYYTVCPFGAVFSAHFWARLGAFSWDCSIAFAGLHMQAFFMSMTCWCFRMCRSFHCQRRLLRSCVCWPDCPLAGRSVNLAPPSLG